MHFSNAFPSVVPPTEVLDESRREDEEDLAALMEVLDLAPAHVAGNSFGGSIALGLAARRPELFRSLIVHKAPLMGLVADDAELRPLMMEFWEGSNPWRTTSAPETSREGRGGL